MPQVERVGRTSMGVRIEVIAHRDLGATEVKVTEGLFTFVALDANNRPRPVDASLRAAGATSSSPSVGRGVRARAARRRGSLRPRRIRRLVAADRRRKHVERDGLVAPLTRGADAPLFVAVVGGALVAVVAARAARGRGPEALAARSCTLVALRRSVGRSLVAPRPSLRRRRPRRKSSSRWRRGFCSSKRARLSLSTRK